MSEQPSYSEQIQKMSPKQGDLLVLNLMTPPTTQQRERMTTGLVPFAQSLGCRLIILEPGMTLSLHVDPAAQFAEQQRQTALLEQLVEQQAALLDAMADDVRADEEGPQTNYLDGSPILGSS